MSNQTPPVPPASRSKHGLKKNPEISKDDKLVRRSKAVSVVSGGLAGVVWTRDDRSHGVRHVDARLPLRPVPEIIEYGRRRQGVGQRRRRHRGASGNLVLRPPRVVRRRFEERFTDARMARDYISTYHQLLRRRNSNGKAIRGWPSPASATCFAVCGELLHRRVAVSCALNLQ